MGLFKKETYLTRYKGNPIITPKSFPYGHADSVMNCGQIMHEGKTVLLLSVIDSAKKMTAIFYAESKDGINFDIREKPLITGLQDPRFKRLDIHVIDPRLTKIGDTYYIARPGNSESGECIAFLYRTKDFKEVEFMDCIALPNNRVPSLFPEKINGYYARLDRPYALGAASEKASVWLSYSPDLIHWGQHRYLWSGNDNWNWGKIGPTPPLKTPKGWLVIMHGVCPSCDGYKYSLGAWMLDLNDPSKMIGRIRNYILTPDELYELVGNVGNVVFACGAIADEDKDQLRVYYGAADTSICLATGSLSRIIDTCLNEGP
ncbi:MAG: hypothetical protein A2X45_16655 [Lentisphaerae bacterium GWF2_50_93]|nr:MAG: hypothetical protein A2X45_16655 [Lentisphaerae bacterium GWF2_50_93]